MLYIYIYIIDEDNGHLYNLQIYRLLIADADVGHTSGQRTTAHWSYVVEVHRQNKVQNILRCCVKNVR